MLHFKQCPLCVITVQRALQTFKFSGEQQMIPKANALQWLLAIASCTFNHQRVTS